MVNAYSSFTMFHAATTKRPQVSQTPKFTAQDIGTFEGFSTLNPWSTDQRWHTQGAEPPKGQIPPMLCQIHFVMSQPRVYGHPRVSTSAKIPTWIIPRSCGFKLSRELDIRSPASCLDFPPYKWCQMPVKAYSLSCPTEASVNW